MNDGFAIGFVVGLLAGIVIGVATLPINHSLWEHEAVAHDAAEFYLDANNERQWRWLDQRPKGTK